MTVLQFLWQCMRAYRSAKTEARVCYFAVVSSGVPEVTCIIAADREAWRLASLAMDAFQPRI